MQKSPHSLIAILDFGSQYTQLIARRVRELGVYSVIVHGDEPIEKVLELRPSALILSGGPASVYDPGSPQLAPGFLEAVRREKLPLLGICYGMQVVAQAFGGKVEKSPHREYGRMPIRVEPDSELLGAWARAQGGTQGDHEVWMSHGDEVRALPPGFRQTARSASGALAAIENSGEKVYLVQFHPEVTHTRDGAAILRRFVLDLAHVAPDWTMAGVREEELAKIQARVGPDDHVICALSGGVDSVVAATLVHQAIGDRLHCVFVDNGLLRFEERDRVMETFQRKLHLPVTCVDASREFLSKLAGVADPEKKRKIIGAEFITVFQNAAREIEKRIGKHPRFLVQGTLYPDVIESSPPIGEGAVGMKSGLKHSTTIKSHHNVGGLPEKLGFQLIEPLRSLFKDEVRALGRVLGVPDEFLRRHPFPGPGLAVRVLGPVEPEALEILRRVDEVFIQALHAEGLYDKIWQAFAVFLPIRSVGVQGDGRTHDHVVALRAVTSSDGMTADWFHFEPGFLARVSSRICNQVKGVNRVVYDISSKPPATIEWE